MISTITAANHPAASPVSKNTADDHAAADPDDHQPRNRSSSPAAGAMRTDTGQLEADVDCSGVSTRGLA